jgi:hypothetical protein
MEQSDKVRLSAAPMSLAKDVEGVVVVFEGEQKSVAKARWKLTGEERALLVVFLFDPECCSCSRASPCTGRSGRCPTCGVTCKLRRSSRAL